MIKKDQAYYQDLVRQYMDGTISKEDRFELEKQALDDPFLFEALEGLNLSRENSSAAINSLKEKIEQPSQENRTKRIPLFNYGVAASLILLLGIGFWTFNQSNSPQDNIALQTEAGQVVKTEEVIESELETPDLSSDNMTFGEKAKEKEVEQNNQYNSPKAVISTKDESVDLAASNKLDPKIDLDTPPTVEIAKTSTEEDQTQSLQPPVAKPAMNQRAEPTEVALDEIKKQVPLKQEQSAKYRKSKVNQADRLEEQIDLTTSAGSSAPSENLQLAREEYIEAIEENILVAPAGGISKFMMSFKETSQEFRNKIKASTDDIVIEFNLNNEGQPIEFEIITGKDQDCINRIVTQLKYGVKWITEPSNSKASVKLELPCY